MPVSRRRTSATRTPPACFAVDCRLPYALWRRLAPERPFRGGKPLLPADLGQCRFSPLVAGGYGHVRGALLQMLVVGVFVYQHAGSAFDVALMTLLQSLPMTL